MAQPIVDVLIIGAGPAGLSAALPLGRQLRTAVIFSTNTFRNARTQHMHMIPTWDHKSPSAFRGAARDEILARYGATISFADVGIASLTRLPKKTISSADNASAENTSSPNLSGDIFSAVDTAGKTWLGRKVLLAHGVVDQMPETLIPGYTDAWARGIFHCLFCHGYEERGAPSVGVLALGMLAPGPHTAAVARMARNLASSVVVYTNGAAGAGQILEDVGLGPRISVDERRIVRVEKVANKGDVDVFFEGGEVRREGFLAHMPDAKVAAPFAELLGCEMNGPGSIKVSQPFYETSVRGVFAAGDISVPAPAVAGAIQSGGFAAVGIVQQLAAEVTE